MLDTNADRPSAREDDCHLLASAAAREALGGVSEITVWRWRRDDSLGFPQPVVIRGRNYWRKGDLRDFLAKLQRRGHRAAGGVPDAA